MHFAARKGNVEVMKALISRGYVVNCMTPTELITPLHEASSKGNVAAVQFLIDEGAWVRISVYFVFILPVHVKLIFVVVLIRSMLEILMVQLHCVWLVLQVKQK